MLIGKAVPRGITMTTYSYMMVGTAANSQHWETHGEISIENPGDFEHCYREAMKDSFMKLTQGKAVYGLPSIGCIGPYTIEEFHLYKHTIERFHQ